MRCIRLGCRITVVGQFNEDILQACFLQLQFEQRLFSVRECEKQAAGNRVNIAAAGLDFRRYKTVIRLMDDGIGDILCGGQDFTHHRGGGIGREHDPAVCQKALFQIVRLVECNQFAVGNNQDPVADRLYFRKDMRTENDRMLLPQLPDQVADFNDLKRVKADGRLVQNDDFGIAQQRLRNTDALLVAFGKRRS